MEYPKLNMEEQKEPNARAKVWCRDCGKEMHQAPYNILAFYCTECKLKANVNYSKTPYIHTLSEEGRHGISPQA